MSNDLGFAEKIDLCEIWKNEACDFSPWLEKNILHLDSLIGLKLKVTGKEVRVGPYLADIVATDLETGETVVIENQLTKTDHDHLGKAIVYASHLHASKIIWIAPEFTKEHQEALRWLNRRMKKADVKFYGIQIIPLQVENNEPSIHFFVVAKPPTFKQGIC